MECLLVGVGLMLADRMLLVGTTAMAAAVMYRCRWEEEGVGVEEAALPDIVEAVEIAAVEEGGETAAEIPVMKAEVSAAGEAVAEIPVVGEVARGS